MAHPVHGISFAMFLVAFSILLVGFRFLIKKIIIMQDVKKNHKVIKQDIYDAKMQLKIQERIIALKYEKMHTNFCKEFKSRNGKQRALITSDNLFNAIDVDHSGFISIGELRNFNQNKIELLDEIVREADKDMNGTLEREEFKVMWHKMELTKRKKSFIEMDKSKTGMILITVYYYSILLYICLSY